MTDCKNSTGDEPRGAPVAQEGSLQTEISRRRRVEETLSDVLDVQAAQVAQGAESDEMFRLLVESVRDYAIFMLDPKGHVTTWNAGAQRFKGYAAHEIIGLHFSTFYPDEDVRAGKCEHELEVAAREGRLEDEGWRIRKDGSRFWASVVISAMRDKHARLVGFSKVTRDLTERKRSEDERAARLAAEHANKTKDEFLAILGHELRNPLAPIVTALQLIKLRDGSHLVKEHQIIERQVTHMVRLVDDLLDVSRIARGKVELALKQLDVRDVIAKAIEIAGPLLEQRRHHFEVSAPSQPILVTGDESRLIQVFTNLLTNAAKYTEPNGHIYMTVRRAGDQVIVEVRDDGTGIEAELLPRLFELFVQGYQSAERSAGGLGLGLTLVRALVTLHGGQVEARSDGPGRGSCFTVQLPVADRAATAGPDEARSTAVVAPRTCRILVVDDNEDARVLLSEILVAVGHEVRSAGDGLDALAVIEGFAPDVAILDLGLPIMDGYALAARLREAMPRPPCLIALSGYGRKLDHERSQAAGFDRHLVKPVEVNVLLEAIAALQRARPATARARPGEPG